MNIPSSSKAGQPDPIGALPPSFRFGVTTSAYQVEGAVTEDGRTPSIWDTFSRVSGAVADGSTGDTACDHYHRMPADVALLADLGVDTYRFSIAWPRVQPGGRGPANPAGLAFYDRLVDELLARDVAPWATLYHWDLPQELEDAGGWPVRDTAYRFADYAMLVFDRLGDRLRTVSTLNEPWCAAMLGHWAGIHAPGRQSLADASAAAHHLLLGHGLATRRMSAAATRPTEFGVTLNMGTSEPFSDREVDRAAASLVDGMFLRMYLDPLRRGEYPQDVVDNLAAVGISLPIRDGDLDIISTPFTVLGVNYYTSLLISGLDEAGNSRDEDGHPVWRPIPRGLPVTATGAEVVPGELTKLLLRLHREYPGLHLHVTENGAAYHDVVDAQGRVDDAGRTEFLRAHLAATAEAYRRGADVRGYSVWSLLDNFEWQHGLGQRFGIVHVDYETQRRTLKRSALWYRDIIRAVHAPRDVPAGGAGVEATVLGWWAELLPAAPTSPDDDFFEFGGESLHLVQFLQRVVAEYGVELAVTDLFVGEFSARRTAALIHTAMADGASLDGGPAADGEIARLAADLSRLPPDQAAVLLGEGG